MIWWEIWSPVEMQVLEIENKLQNYLGLKFSSTQTISTQTSECDQPCTVPANLPGLHSIPAPSPQPGSVVVASSHHNNYGFLLLTSSWSALLCCSLSSSFYWSAISCSSPPPTGQLDSVAASSLATSSCPGTLTRESVRRDNSTFSTPKRRCFR